MMLGMATSDTTEQIRSYWDEDAAGYDRTPGHYPQTPAPFEVGGRARGGEVRHAR
jgi:hypothetical protein